MPKISKKKKTFDAWKRFLVEDYLALQVSGDNDGNFQIIFVNQQIHFTYIDECCRKP